VNYSPAFHPSFKCTHSGSTCACTLQHPTHHKGGCKQLESKATGKLIDTGGDCTDSGKTTWAGSDLAADVALMTDGATINLAAGTFAWTSQVRCTGKTLTLTGAGKGATILDAGLARTFFFLDSGCTLVLSKLSMRNGNSGGGWPFDRGGAIYAQYGSTLHASDVEFKGNFASHFGGAVAVRDGTASFTSCDFTSNSVGGAWDAKGAVVFADNNAKITFASTHPTNSFSGNTAPNNNYGNCDILPPVHLMAAFLKDKDNNNFITGSCS